MGSTLPSFLFGGGGGGGGGRRGLFGERFGILGSAQTAIGTVQTARGTEPFPVRNGLEFLLPPEGHGPFLVEIFPPLPLGPFREGAVVPGGDIGVPGFLGKLGESIVLVVPGRLQSVPDKVQVVEAFDLGYRQPSLLEVVPLALDPTAQFRIGIAAQDVGVSLSVVIELEVRVVEVPGFRDHAGSRIFLVLGNVGFLVRGWAWGNRFLGIDLRFGRGL